MPPANKKLPQSRTARPRVASQAAPGASLEAQFIAMVEDFADPSQEWRRLFSELLGTFFLVLVAAGGGMMGRWVRPSQTPSAAPPP